MTYDDMLSSIAQHPTTPLERLSDWLLTGGSIREMIDTVMTFLFPIAKEN